MALVAVLAVTPVLGGGGGGANGFGAFSREEAANFVVPDDMVLVQSFHLDAYGLDYERYQQVYGGPRAQVAGAQITVYRDSSGTAKTVVGAHYEGITPTNNPGRSNDDANRSVDRDIGPGGERRVTLMIDPSTGLYFHRVETRRFASRWFHWVDAENGGILSKYNAIATDHGPGDGVGVKGDTKDLTNLTSLQTRGRPSSRGYWLYSQDSRQRTYDNENDGFNSTIMVDANNHWDLPGTSSPGQPAGVDAHYYASVTDGYLIAQHGLDWVAESGYEAQISIVHYLSGEDNAFWNGAHVVYGDGSMLFRELSGGLDVVVHEHGHGVTDCSSNLIYQNESGALNESVSDFLASSAEFYCAANGLDPTVTPDWLIGEDVYLLPGDAAGFRNMSDPAEDDDPDHYSELLVGDTDNGFVHSNSGIPNHASYLLVNGGSNAGEERGHAHSGPVVTAIGLAAAEQIFFLGITSLPSNATMADARASTEAMTSSLFGPASQELQSTTDAWAAVGVAAPGPEPLNITTTSPPDGTVGEAYSTNVEATGGTLPYSWSILSGELPSGLTLNSSTGEISGTPDTEETQTLTVRVTDDLADMDDQELSITINAAAAGTGSIRGTVTDTSGNRLRNAVVETDTVQSATTNRRGMYRLKDVPEGLRTVTATLGTLSAQDTVTVVADGTVELNLVLQ